MPKVIVGEASESDSEVELGKSMNSCAESPSDSAKAFVIAGEASESEEDFPIPIRPSPVEADIIIRDDTMAMMSGSPSKIQHTSLLHQKLWECNVSLRASLEYFLKHSTELASDKLTRADKLLLNVQENMRSISANLTLAATEMKRLNQELKKASLSNALDSIKIS